VRRSEGVLGGVLGVLDVLEQLGVFAHKAKEWP
jgi:hypothetical protein